MNFKGKRRIFILCWIMFLFVAPGCKKECDFWLEGKKCDTEVRLEYYGNYNGVVEKNILTPIFLSDRFDVDVVVTEYANDEKRMFLQDPVFGEIYVVLTTEDSFTIPFQSFDPVMSERIEIKEGSGTFNSGQLSYAFSFLIEQPDGYIGIDTMTFAGAK